MTKFSCLLFLVALVFACKPVEDKLRDMPAKNLDFEEKQRQELTIKRNAAPRKIGNDHDPYFNENNGIHEAPRSITRNMIQDRDGDIWFGTWEGIFRYDGKTFINHTNQDSLRRYRGFSTMEDSKGNIWIGTIGAGAYVCNKQALKKGKPAWQNLDTLAGLVNNDVGCLFEDSKGNIWLGTRVGVSCYDGNTFKNFTKKDGLVDHDINGIIEDKEGKIWFAARGEACYYDGEKFTKLVTPEGQTFINARSIVLDSKGNIWIGGNNGLWRYDGKEFKDFKTPFIGNIYEDNKGTIWVSQSDVGISYSMTLNRYDLHDLYKENPSSTLVTSGKGQIFGVLEDKDGNIWFGHERGVCRYDGLSFEYFED